MTTTELRATLKDMRFDPMKGQPFNLDNISWQHAVGALVALVDHERKVSIGNTDKTVAEAHLRNVLNHPCSRVSLVVSNHIAHAGRLRKRRDVLHSAAITHLTSLLPDNLPNMAYPNDRQATLVGYSKMSRHLDKSYGEYWDEREAIQAKIEAQTKTKLANENFEDDEPKDDDEPKNEDEAA